MLTRARHERIIELLQEGTPFATACRTVGISPSAGYDWLYRGWGTHPSRSPTPAFMAFAQDVDAVFPGGFTERHPEEEPAEASGSSRHVQAHVDSRATAGHVGAHVESKGFVEAQSRSETGERPADFEFVEAGFSDVTEKEPRYAPMPWLSQRSRRDHSILDEEF